MKKIKNEKRIVLTDELREKYKENLREELYLKENKEEYLKNEGEFFNKFRRKEKCENKLERDFPNSDDDVFDKYMEFIKLEEKEIEDKVNRINNLIDYERFFLNWERRLITKYDKNKSYNSNSATRYRVDQIKRLEDEKSIILNSSSVAKDYYNKKKILLDIENQNNGKLINVDYVDEAKKKIKKALINGNPINIFGHLGSGKTAIATEAAVEYAVERKIQSYLELSMETWYIEHIDADFEEMIENFSSFNSYIKKYYKNILNNPLDSQWQELQPLFISGSHNLTYEDMFVEKTLKLENTFSVDSLENHLKTIAISFNNWILDHKNELKEMSDEEAINAKIEIWKSLSDILVAQNSSFGTEIKKIEKEILIALRQGRVVIIDELNAIAMSNLIALNDILQKKRGEYVYVTGVGAVKIEDGFAIIGTGNLSNSTVNYEGTNELNPAFKSRFINMEYNYLPQNLTGEYNNQSDLYENQLFRVIITRLLDLDGSLRIPYPQRSIDELFRFAQLSRLTQNVFMGKWRDSQDGERDIVDIELRESVLSIRNIMRVLDEWNLGEEKDFSKALWDAFISSITSPEDQNYILSQAIRFGFFNSSEGWNNELRYSWDYTLSFEDIRKEKYTYTRPKLEILSIIDVGELIYGKYSGEDRKLMDYLDLNISSNEKNINADEYIEYDKKIRNLESSSEIIDYIFNNSKKDN
ncbi:AAA domain (dynein-related subfamily) [Peptostreptococcus russellii]|uniref:AAA domain (Dynein-related subfamily) n=1 Tax=Peptostreptococcus russellii TaxID=215200 RepID=A0A1H8GQN4_9FIRM|nr:AAA family ATPase [Peptostreptococcus russellii]SEN46129.1 AAA domain (dynein-related subfamily) [Peptostreptococcus russellii]